MEEILYLNFADPQTIDHYCGIDDLKRTCTPASRNYNYGLALFQNEAPAKNTTIEGLTTLREIRIGKIILPENATLIRSLLPLGRED